MAWSPALHSLSRAFIARNLLAWIKDAGNGGARQTQALAWAKTQLGFAGAVPNFAAVYNSSEGWKRSVFPDLMLVRRSTRFEKSTDGVSVRVVHTFGWEMQIADADADTLTEKVEVYCAALKALLWSCPPATMKAGCPTQGHPVLDVTDDDGDQTRGDGPWIQIPRIVATVELLEVRSG